MGKGGHNTRIGTTDEQQVDTTLSTNSIEQLPKLSEIKVKLPDHCFRPTVRQSMSYVVKDIVYVALTFIAMYKIQTIFQYGFLLFPIYQNNKENLMINLCLIYHSFFL